MLGYRPCGLASGDFEPNRLEISDRLMERFGHAGADQLNILLASARSARQVAEAIAIRRAVGVGRTNQDVLPWDFFYHGTDLVAQRGGKPEKVCADNSHQGSVLVEHQRPHRQVALPSGRRMGGSNATADGQQWVR